MAGEYEKIKLLGSGSYGKAWLANSRRKKRQVVLKEIKLDCLSDKEIEQALVEVKILAKCRHVNIVWYWEAFESFSCLYIAMEFAENGDLQKKILEQRGIHFNNETILDWFIQICFALKYLHTENILHRDLKPQNLFLTSDGIVKVGDFGIARILQETGDHAVTAIGTPYYLSPEICQRKPYNSKSDMWSVGCVLYELCCLRVPFQAPNLPLLVLSILQGQYDPIPRHCGVVLEDLVSVLLKADPSQRPTAQQVLNVPALQPYVAASYRRCLKHKHQRQQRRLSPREPCSPGLYIPKEVAKPSPCCPTFRVKSPLVRRLSVATPRLKAAVKRQRSVQSAEAIHTRKKCKQSSRAPVFSLQEAFLDLRPSHPSCPDLSPPHPPQMSLSPSSDARHRFPVLHHSGRENREPVSHTPPTEKRSEDTSIGDTSVDTGPDRNESSDFDDVFEDIANTPAKEGGPDASFLCLRNSPGVEEQRPKQSRVSDRKTESVSSTVHCFPLGKNMDGDDFVHSAVPRLDHVTDHGKPTSNLPKPPCMPVESNQSSTDREIAKLFGKQGGKASNQHHHQILKRKQSVDSSTCTVVSQVQSEGKPQCPRCRKGEQQPEGKPQCPRCRKGEQQPEGRCRKGEQQFEGNPRCRKGEQQSEGRCRKGEQQFEGKPQCPRCRKGEQQSEGKPQCPRCRKGEQQSEGKLQCPRCKTGERQPQHCLHEALFQATALSYRDKAAAQRCLSQCLIAHLGSEISLRLCSLVNLALQAGEDYTTLEAHLDEECRCYLPLIFHLLTWRDEEAVEK